MTPQTEIDKLKSLPPLTQQVCATCEFLNREPERIYREPVCRANETIARWTYEHRCQGQMWAPRLPVLVRFKRWLVG